MPIQSTAVQIPGLMVQYMPAGQFKNWADAADAGAPDWVKYYLDYQGFNYNKNFKIVLNNVTLDYAIISVRV